MMQVSHKYKKLLEHAIKVRDDVRCTLDSNDLLIKELEKELNECLSLMQTDCGNSLSEFTQQTILLKKANVLTLSIKQRLVFLHTTIKLMSMCNKEVELLANTCLELSL